MTHISCNIPLKSINATVDICNNICELTFDQIYFNDDKQPIEVNYVFPSIPNTSVYDFRAVINDTIVIETQIKPKETAIKEYNQAIREGKKTILMEKLNGDIFSICLGNVPPDAVVNIRIRCVVELLTEIDAKNLRLAIPLTIMPKYSSGTSIQPGISNTSGISNSIPRVSEKPYEFKLEGKIYMSDGIVSLDSKTHKIKLSNMGSTQINFEINPENLDQDIILSITRNKPMSFIISESALELPSSNSAYKYASQVNIIPDFTLVPETNIINMSYIIVIDRSGSMSGTAFTNAINSAVIFVSALPFGSKFNIYEFGSDYTKFSPEMVVSSAESKQKSVQWLKSLSCNGGTEVLRVMQDVYLTLKDNPGSIIFLSDGGVDDTNLIMQLVRANHNIGIYTIGIGQNVSHELIDGMAKNSYGGVAEYINSTDDQIREKVLAHLNRSQQAMRPCQQNNKITVNTTGVYKMIPEVMNLYEGDCNTFYILSEQPIESVTYDQCNPDGISQKTHTLQNSIVSIAGSAIHRIAGLKLIDLQIDQPGGSQIARFQQDTAKDEIIKISSALGVLSKHTAFIGVEITQTSNGPVETPLLKQTPLLKYVPLQQGGNTLGSTTIGSSFKNATFDLRACCVMPKYNVKSMSVSKSQSRGQFMLGDSSSDEAGDGPDDWENQNFSKPVRGKEFEGGWDSLESGVVSNNITRQSSKYDHKSSESEEEDDGGCGGFDFFGYESSTTPQVKSVAISSNGFGGQSVQSKPWEKTNNNVTSTKSKSWEKTNNNVTPTKPKVTVSFVIKTKLTNYMILDKILSSTVNGLLPFHNKFKVNAYIELTMQEKGINGIYKVISIGSNNSPWILEKVEN